MPKRFWPTQKARKASSDYSNLASPTVSSSVAAMDHKKASSNRWRDKGGRSRRKDLKSQSRPSQYIPTQQQYQQHFNDNQSDKGGGWDPFESPTSVAQHEHYFSNEKVIPFEGTEWSNAMLVPQCSPTEFSNQFPSSHQNNFNSNSNSNARANNNHKSGTRSRSGSFGKQSKEMTFRELLSVIFAAFWDRADLYTDVLGLEHDYPSDRQLRLAFFRQGRIILATPIESPDDMTTLSFGSRASGNDGNGNVRGVGALPTNLVQAGVAVSRKAKLKFQAISVAYDLLSNAQLKATYDEWRIWNTRKPLPGSWEEDKILGINLGDLRRNAISMSHDEESMATHSVGLSNAELADIIVAGSNSGAEPYSISDTASYSDFSRISTNSILQTGQFSTFRERRQDRRLQRAQFGGNSDRTITWNEEVEELVLLDIDENDEHEAYNKRYESEEEAGGYYDTSNAVEPDQYQENHDSFSSNSKAYQYQDLSADDPYMQNNGVFFSSDAESTQGTYNKNKKIGQRDNGIRQNPTNPLAQHAHTNSSADSSSIRRPLKFANQNPDDSLVTILDGPLSKILTNSQNASAPLQTPVWYEHAQRLTTEHKELNPIITQEETIVTNEDKDKNDVLKVRVQVQSSSRSRDVPVEKPLTVDDVFRPFDKVDLDAENFPFYVDSGFSIASEPTASSAGDCVGIDLADTLNVAIGFQSSLSNYISGAVSEMKDNMTKLGKKWEELDLLQMGEGKDENSFFIQASELDAMMGMLRAEIESPPSAPSCDSTDLNQSADVSSIVRQSCGVDARCV